jgi:hypothetical protein
MAPSIAIKTQIGWDGSRGAGMKRTKQGKRDEARPMLANVYRWFIAGLDTPRLKDGKASLHDLKGSALTSLQQRAPSRAKGRDVLGKSPAGFSAWPIDHSMSVARVA